MQHTPFPNFFDNHGMRRDYLAEELEGKCIITALMGSDSWDEAAITGGAQGDEGHDRYHNGPGRDTQNTMRALPQTVA